MDFKISKLYKFFKYNDCKVKFNDCAAVEAIDFARAFDTIDTEILLDKLAKIGICTDAVTHIPQNGNNQTDKLVVYQNPIIHLLMQLLVVVLGHLCL